MADLKNSHLTEVNSLREHIANLQSDADALRTAKEEACKTAEEKPVEIEKLKENHSSAISQSGEAHAAEISILRGDHASEVLKLREDHSTEGDTPGVSNPEVPRSPSPSIWVQFFFFALYFCWAPKPLQEYFKICR